MQILKKTTVIHEALIVDEDTTAIVNLAVTQIWWVVSVDSNCSRDRYRTTRRLTL